ncbi:MAG: PhoH family protein [Burkholderiales bacterium]|nr:PhoH family protein [Burkholderiales bacterium]
MSLRRSEGFCAPEATPIAASPESDASMPVRRARPSGRKSSTRLFVLDSNVLMHDPTSLYRFEEHDIYLPIVALEELDAHKQGMSEVARNARQSSRFLDAIVSRAQGDIARGIALRGGEEAGAPGEPTGRLFLQTELIDGNLPPSLPIGKADNQILGVVMHLQKKFARRAVILVSKDINMRIKARALGLAAEDYFNDKVLEDTDLLYTGVRELAHDFWEQHARDMESWKKDGRTYYRVRGPICRDLLQNEFVYQEGERPLQALVREAGAGSALLETIRDYSHARNNVWGITARNREQNFALNLLMNPEIDFVTLLGQAGTGKTLLALAAGLAQTLDSKLSSELIRTRVTVPVGEDIGFLPGTEEEKMTPWMGALEDNLDVLNRTDQEGGEWGRAATRDLIRSRIKVKSLNFMRGRTFIRTYLIIDEAQNLTPKQMKTLVTRAGPGAKVVCLGNISQIDTPYLTEGSSGLTYVVDRFKGWPHSGHVTLARGERSRLADHAGEVL